jgi:stalled ribosome alternative rescue factor ArfA
VRKINPIARVMLSTRRRQSSLVKQNKKGKGSYARQNDKKLSKDTRQEID